MLNQPLAGKIAIVTGGGTGLAPLSLAILWRRVPGFALAVGVRQFSTRLPIHYRRAQ
jgi:hypothetical protein